MNRDALNAVSPHQAAQAAFRAVDALQDHPSEQQVAGVALLFLMVAKRNRMVPREVSEMLDQAGRRLEDALAPSADRRAGDLARALRGYLREEL